MLSVLIYAVPAVAILTTLYTGYLGWKFYVDEILRRR
jgi:hypothetical protein